MSPSEARKFVRMNCRHHRMMPTGCILCGEASSFEQVQHCQLFSDRLEITGVKGGRYVFPYSTMTLTFDGPGDGILNFDRRWRLWGPPKSTAQRMGQALLVLKQGSTGKDAAQELSRFEQEARAYREANVKPQLSEDVRRLRVQAEAAVREKRFEDAADLYEDALRLAPWWPEGRFNRALLLGEMADYASAIDEMNKYLLLVPNASDARAAKDKVYEWESKAPRSRR